MQFINVLAVYTLDCVLQPAHWPGTMAQTITPDKLVERIGSAIATGRFDLTAAAAKRCRRHRLRLAVRLGLLAARSK